MFLYGRYNCCAGTSHRLFPFLTYMAFMDLWSHANDHFDVSMTLTSALAVQLSGIRAIVGEACQCILTCFHS